MQNHYVTLGVWQDASEAEIHSAYRRLARHFHPDLNPGDSEAAGRFRAVQDAYDVLSDPEGRRKHDKWLESFGVVPPHQEPPKRATPAAPAAAAPDPQEGEVFWPLAIAFVTAVGVAYVILLGALGHRRATDVANAAAVAAPIALLAVWAVRRILRDRRDRQAFHERRARDGTHGNGAGAEAWRSRSDKRSDVASHYVTLRVPPDASPDEITAAFRARVLELHGDDPAFADRLRAAQKAYSVLSDPTARRRYDFWLASFRAAKPWTRADRDASPLDQSQSWVRPRRRPRAASASVLALAVLMVVVSVGVEASLVMSGRLWLRGLVAGGVGGWWGLARIWEHLQAGTEKAEAAD